MDAGKISAAIGKLQSAHWHTINRTVNEGLVPGLILEAVHMLGDVECADCGHSGDPACGNCGSHAVSLRNPT